MQWLVSQADKRCERQNKRLIISHERHRVEYEVIRFTDGLEMGTSQQTVTSHEAKSSSLFQKP